MRQVGYTPYATGWYGIPGGLASRSTKVHVINRAGPICGSIVGAAQEFQWCAWGKNISMIECERCLATVIKEHDDRPTV